MSREFFRGRCRRAESRSGQGLRAVLAAAGMALAFSAPTAVAQTVGTLGDVKLSADEVKHMLENEPQVRSQITASPDILERLVREQLVRRALVEEALAKGWDKRPDVARLMAQAREQVLLNTYLNSFAQLPAGYPSEDEIRAYYEANQGRFMLPERYHLAQIYIKLPAAEGEARDDAAKRAADIERQARATGADFDALARAVSEEEASRSKGGDLGWMAETNLIPEIRNVLPGLKAGEVSSAVLSANGWHIVKLIEAKPSSVATLEEARPAVINALRAQKAGELRQAHIDALLKKTPVSLDSAVLSNLRSDLK